MSLTLEELRVAAEAAERWPQGTPSSMWGFDDQGVAVAYPERVTYGG